MIAIDIACNGSKRKPGRNNDILRSIHLRILHTDELEFKSMAKVNFVIVSQPRSGSTFLIDTLSSNEQVFCDNELYNLTMIARLDSNNDNTDLAAVKRRDCDPVSFYHEFYGSDFAKRIYALGFNFMLGHHSHVLKTIVEDQSLKIIYLERENKLAQASSWFRALDDRIWATRESAQIDLEQKNTFNRYAYNEYIRAAQTLDYLFKLAVLNRGNVLHVTYVDFSDMNALLMRIASFLTVRDEFTFSDIKKQNPNRIGNRFVNDKDAKKYLTAVNQAHWLEDEL